LRIEEVNGFSGGFGRLDLIYLRTSIAPSAKTNQPTRETLEVMDRMEAEGST
jgi:hypothetical protein